MKCNLPIVEILMSTYNGELFLNEQIQSLFAQTYKNWILRVRDDGSTDSTKKILNFYLQKYPEKIIFHDDDEHLGVCQSFNKLLIYSNSDYIMFCDQDDIWLPFKIDITLKRVIELENKYGKQTPILVFTDMIVGDFWGNTICQSYWKYSAMNYKNVRYTTFLVKNIASGNTIMMNKSAVKICTPIPACAPIHDWWCALVVSVFGVVDYIEKPTIIYRQHGRNDLGAKRWTFLDALKRLHKMDGFNKNLNYSIMMAKCFLDKYSNYLNYDVKVTIQKFINIKHLNRIERLKFLVSKNFVSLSLRDIGSLLFRWSRI